MFTKSFSLITLHFIFYFFTQMLNKMSKEFALFIVYWHDVAVSFRRNNEMYFVIKIESGGHINFFWGDVHTEKI